MQFYKKNLKIIVLPLLNLRGGYCWTTGHKKVPPVSFQVEQLGSAPVMFYGQAELF
jgi:hypothetical protein